MLYKNKLKELIKEDEIYRQVVYIVENELRDTYLKGKDIGEFEFKMELLCGSNNPAKEQELKSIRNEIIDTWSK